MKHFVANESETDRHYVDSQVSEAALRELYLLPFEICVADAHPWTVMAAYNDVNGVAATEQDELNNGVLKSEWAWDGLLMSDWGATKTAGPAADGGLDLVMPGPDGPWGDVLVTLVEAGRGGRGRPSTSTYAGCSGWPAGWARWTACRPNGPRCSTARPHRPTPWSRDALRDLAADGMVLLKGQDVLPLDETAVTDQAPVVLVGMPALHTTLMGGGSASLRPPHEISIAHGLTEALGVNRIRVVDGVEVRQHPLPAAPDAVIDPQTGNPGVRIVSFDGDGTERASTTGDVAQVDPRHGVRSAQRGHAARAQCPADRPDGQPGAGRRTRGGGVDADLRRPDVPGRPGRAGRLGGGGLHGPTELVDDGRRPPPDEVLVARLTVPLGERFALAGLIAEAARVSDDDAIAAAALAARDAETAVVVVGLTAEQETEAVDKATLALPGRQDELVARRRRRGRAGRSWWSTPPRRS